MILTAILAATLAAASPQCASDATHAAAVCRALAAQAENRYADSATAFETAAAASRPGDPAAARALAAAGNMWIAAGQPAKAALVLDRALAGNALVAVQRGEALLDRARAAEAQGDLKMARAKLSGAAATIAADPFYWYFSAALAVREEDVPTAKLAIARALTLAPGDPTILFEAGHVASLAGEDAKARDYWTRAAAADPNGASGRAARRALGLLPVPLTVSGSAQPSATDE